MNAHIHLVSAEAAEADSQDLDETAAASDEAPLTLPEEGGSSRNDGVDDAPPPLVADREERACRAPDVSARTKKRRVKLMALAWRSKVKGAAPIGRHDEGEGVGEGERKEEASTRVAAADGVDGESGKRAAVEAKAKRFAGVGVAGALAASVAVAAIVVLNWPTSAPPPAVEPGMLADGQTKLMAPSAALAKAPPREVLNVSEPRPRVHETRGDELNEMLSFKSGAAEDGSNPKRSGPPVPPAPMEKMAKAAPPLATEAAAVSAGVPSAASELEPGAPVAPVKAVDAAPPPSHPQAAAPSAAASADARESAAVAPSAGAPPPEPGMGQVARIEARVADLEAAFKDRANDARVRLEAEEAETHTLEKIAELGALVTRLTGQVKDLKETVQTLSQGSEQKFADLTRRVALGEADRAVASAERAGETHSASEPQEKGSADGSVAAQTRMKVMAEEAKRNYRIQAASPGLAMLTAVDGSPDDRPVEVAIGTELPGYGKVRSIEQHGQSWVVKAERGSIQ
jgi:hypothetical protein